MILDQLRSATAAAHASLERRLRIARSAPSLSDYRNYLRALYGFTAPLESRLRQLPAPLPSELELEQRYKANLLEQDLRAIDERLGPASEAIAWCSALPRSDDHAHALGTLYVLEGSTLGARWLLRHLAPLRLDDCSAYLRSYGDALGPMWEKLRAVLSRYAEQHPEQVPEVLATASETFRTLDDWFVQCQAAEASVAA